MRTFIIAITTAFLAVTIASAFSLEAYAVRWGTMHGYDNTYRSHKGHKCFHGHCAPVVKKKKQ